jgi:hypothetical protein
MAWWNKHKDEMTLLFKMTQFIFSIPPSSAACEGNFSYAGLVSADNRASLIWKEY